MKLSEYKDEKALDVLANMIEPLSEILSDEDVKKAAKAKKRFKAVAIAIKNHKSAVMEVMAALDDVPIEEYHCNVLTLPAKVIEIISDPDVSQLFTFAGQTEEAMSSGSLMENIEAEEQ